LLDKASQFLSRDTEILHLLAECYLQIGETEKAEEAYRRINRLEPYDEDVKEKLVELARA
jgi:cytochrome c-type biogenesis protein CcmH/NrfG